MTRRSRGAGSCANATDAGGVRMTTRHRAGAPAAWSRDGIRAAVAVNRRRNHSLQPLSPSRSSRVGHQTRKRRTTSTSSSRPIALYPDALLGQMLLCAENPAKIGALSEWLRSQSRSRAASSRTPRQGSGFEREFRRAGRCFPQVVNTWREQIDVDDAARPGVHRRPRRRVRQHPAAAHEGARTPAR